MLNDALERGDLVRCLPDYTTRSYPVFLSFRPGARDIARVAAVIEVAKEFVPALLKY